MIGSVVGIGLSMASSYLSNKSTNDQISQQNRLNELQWADNKQFVAEMLTTSAYRTDRAYAEATRAAIRTKMAAKRAGMQARGQAEVKAAQMGVAGKRASQDITRDISRQEADVISDANINLQTELTNITEHFNDTAHQAIQNLNNSRPTIDSGISTISMLTQAGAAGLSYYNSMSEVSKAEFKNFFKSDSGSGSVSLVKG